MAELSPDIRLGLCFLLLFQVIVWTVIPILGQHAAPLDVIEMYTWSKAPQWGYYKHPPLPAWVIGLSIDWFGRTSLALFVPSAVSVALTTWAVWPLARRLLGQRRGLLALFLQSTLAYTHISATDYNHNVAQMPFWALSVTAFYFALTDGRLRWWIGFGAALGMAALGKYSAGFLPLACLALLLWDREARRFVSLPNLTVAAGAFFVCFGPHLAWLVQHDFAPLHYMSQRMGDLSANATWAERFVSYLGMQVLAHLIPLGVVLWMLLSGVARPSGGSGDLPPANRLNDRFLWVIGLGPFAVTLLIGLGGSYLHPMWASAMFPLSGLIAVQLLGWRADRLLRRRWAAGWLGVMLLLAGFYAFRVTPTWHAMTGKNHRSAYPGPELARRLDQTWRGAFPGRPLKYLIGTSWEAGVASFYSSFDTQVLIDGDFKLTPWILPAEIDRCGAMLVWEYSTDLLPALQARWPDVREETIRVAAGRPGTFALQKVVTAMIPPRQRCATD